MESLLAQIEAWLIGLIDKRILEEKENLVSANVTLQEALIVDFEKVANAIFDQRIANESVPFNFEEDVKTIVSKMPNSHTTPIDFEEDVKNALDRCLVDNFFINFDISRYESEIKDYAVETIDCNFDISNHLNLSDYSSDIMGIVGDEFDISEFSSDIESIVDDRISAAEYTVSVET